MKCKCGNELGKPVVSPREWSFMPASTPGKKSERVSTLFMAGFSQHEKCWFCQFPIKGVT